LDDKKPMVTGPANSPIQWDTLQDLEQKRTDRELLNRLDPADGKPLRLKGSVFSALTRNNERAYLLKVDPLDQQDANTQKYLAGIKEKDIRTQCYGFALGMLEVKVDNKASDFLLLNPSDVINSDLKVATAKDVEAAVQNKKPLFIVWRDVSHDKPNEPKFKYNHIAVIVLFKPVKPGSLELDFNGTRVNSKDGFGPILLDKKLSEIPLWGKPALPYDIRILKEPEKK
jgi:hypothetical protein